jgi:hypothetical protein
MTDILHASSFEGRIGAIFSTSDTSARLQLNRVDAMPSTPGSEQFSLAFTPMDDFPQSQGTYELVDDVLGHLTMFLVPTMGESGAVEMEACFNNLVPPTDSRDETWASPS